MFDQFFLVACAALAIGFGMMQQQQRINNPMPSEQTINQSVSEESKKDNKPKKDIAFVHNRRSEKKGLKENNDDPLVQLAVHQRKMRYTFDKSDSYLDLKCTNPACGFEYTTENVRQSSHTIYVCPNCKRMTGRERIY